MRFFPGVRQAAPAGSSTLVIALLAVFALLPPGIVQTVSADTGPLEKVGSWPFGSASAVAFDPLRNLVYLGSGGAVLVLDVGDISNPLLLSDDIETGGLVTGLRYDPSTQRLYAAAGSAYLQIWDMQDPAAPQLLSIYQVPTAGVDPPVGNVDLYGNFALVELDWIGAGSVDVSDPANPVLVGLNSSAGSSTSDIHVSADGYLHVVGSEYYARIHIEPDGSIPGFGGVHIGNARVVFGTEDAAFIEQYGDMRIIDLGGGYGGSVTDVGYFYDAVIIGDLAYLAGSSELKIYNVSDLTAPYFVGSVGAGGSKLEVAGEYAYLAGGSSGLLNVDVSDPENPMEVGSYETFGASRTTYVDGDHGYIAQGGKGVVIIDLTNPADPVQVGLYDTPGTAYDVMVADDYAYVADYDGGLRIADVSDPSSPSEVGHAELDNAYVVKVVGDMAYVIDNVLNEPDWLRIYDVSNPAGPAERGSLLLVDDVDEIDVLGDYLYAAADDSGMRVLDVSDPGNPVEVGSFIAENTWDVSVRGNLAYLASADWNGGFMALDISDPANPVLLGNYVPNDGWYHPFDLAVAGDFAYLSNPVPTTGGLVMLYIADPTAPVELSSFSPPGDMYDITAKDSLIYVSDGNAGLLVLENQLFSVPGGGVGWVEQVSGTTEDLRSVHFADQVKGWIAGDNGTILHTNNGGADWLPQISGTGEDLFAIQFLNETTGWAGGRGGVILKTTDGGVSWLPQTSGTGQQIRSIKFVDASLGWAVGCGGTILHTTDGGNSWQPQTSGTTECLLSVSFVDADHGWTAGGFDEDALTLRTTDGGTTWMPVYPPDPMVGPSSIQFVNPEVGWLVGYDATIFKSTDGGASWVEQFSDTGTSYTSFSSVYALNENTCWAVGYTGVEGRSMKTVDSGENWMDLLGGGDDILQSVFFVDQNNGWAVGHYGTILMANTADSADYFFSSVGDAESPVDGGPDRFGLVQNYPNPFNPSTTISYRLTEPASVSLKVFDVSGRLVRVLKDAVFEEAGPHQVVWKGEDRSGLTMASGIYFCRLEWSGGSETRRMVLVR